MYAKIVDEETKKVLVGIGTDSDYYKSIGMEDMEVEQGSDGSWYVKGYASKKTLDELKANAQSEVETEFDRLRAWKCKDVYLTSSLGFRVNADSLSAENISSLANLLPDETTTTAFKIYDNSFKQLNKPQLETLYKECQSNGLALYTQKFTKLAKISAATTESEVAAVNATFTMSDYSTADASTEATTASGAGE